MTAPDLGRFFEPQRPFFQPQEELATPPRGDDARDNLVARRVVLPLVTDAQSSNATALDVLQR